MFSSQCQDAGCGVCESLLPQGLGQTQHLLCCLLFATTVSHGVNQGPAWVCVLCFSDAHSGLTSVGPPGESDQSLICVSLTTHSVSADVSVSGGFVSAPKCPEACSQASGYLLPGGID